MTRLLPVSTLFPYTTLFRSVFPIRPMIDDNRGDVRRLRPIEHRRTREVAHEDGEVDVQVAALRSEEHTSELQSRGHLVCRLLLEKKKDHKSLANLTGTSCDL